VRQYLRAIAEALRPCGRAAAFYLTAAVSDFFIPWADMVRTAVPVVPSLAQHLLCKYALSCTSFLPLPNEARQCVVVCVPAITFYACAAVAMLAQAEHKIQSAGVGDQLHLKLEKARPDTRPSSRIGCVLYN
jgi:hypothetical protein